MSVKLLNDALQGKAAFFIQFGGQGASWYKEFIKYKENPEMKLFYEAVFEGIDSGLEYIQNTPVLTYGFDLKKWFHEPDSLPDEEYLISAPLSLPMIQAAQFAHYENFRLNGYDRDTFMEHSKGASGHSQGVISAGFAVYDIDKTEYYDFIKKYTQYLFLMGIRAQEIHPDNIATEIEKEKAASLELKNPAPMAALLGSEHKTVEAMVESYNENKDDNEKIFVSLYNTEKNRIVSGHRSSLLKFYEDYKDNLKENEIDFVFLRTTCPFHSAHMRPMIEKFQNDMQNIGFELYGSRLKKPLYSFVDGRNLQHDEKLAMVFCEELMLKPLYWEKGLLPAIQDSSVTHILDFGPGKTSQRLSDDIFKSQQCEKPIYSAAVLKDQKILFEPG